MQSSEHGLWEDTAWVRILVPLSLTISVPQVPSTWNGDENGTSLRVSEGPNVHRSKALGSGLAIQLRPHPYWLLP